jgi:signal transduction histidine kinase
VGRGSGQGLAIARTIVVDKHEGYIGVVSTPNVGTCFTLRLPVGGRGTGMP